MLGRSAVEGLREVLRQEIVDQMKVGDMLPNERELAERFGVARNTVRETMIHLEAFGLIEKTRRGARVRQPDLDPFFATFVQQFDHSAATLENVLNFRRIVETGAVPFAVTGVTDEVLARMELSNLKLERALTASEAAGHDYDFHLGLIEAAGNAVLLRMYRQLSVPLKFYLEVGKSHRRETEMSMLEHGRIIAGLKQRDPQALVQALNDHFDHSAAVMADFFHGKNASI